MPASPKTPAKTPPRAAAVRPRNDNNDRRWLRRFLMTIAVLTFISIGIVVYYGMKGRDTEVRNTYVAVEIKTLVADGQFIICKVNLLADENQQQMLLERKKDIENIVQSVLADMYTHDGKRPPLPEVQDELSRAINARMPAKMKFKEVLIDSLLVGNS